MYIFQRLQIALALLAHASLVSLKNLLVLITPNCKRNHVITYTYFHPTGLHPLHHRQLQVLPVHLVLLTMVSNDPDSTNSLTNLQGWFGHHSYHSGQTSSMRKWINLARAKFLRKTNEASCKCYKNSVQGSGKKKNERLKARSFF